MENRILLIQNGMVVTMKSPESVFRPGYVYVEGNRIADVGPMDKMNSAYLSADKVIDAKDMIVCPGFIDAHYHVCQQWLRSLYNLLAARGISKYPGWKWTLIPFEALLSEEDIYISSLHAYINMVKMGTTFTAEHGCRLPDTVARAMQTIGIRGHLAMATVDMDPDLPKLPAAAVFPTEEIIRQSTDLVRRYPFGGDNLVQGVFSMRQIGVCTPKLIQAIAGLAEQYQTMIQTHLCEGHYELNNARLWYGGVPPIQFLKNIGVLSPRWISAHTVLVTENEVDLLASHGVKVAHCPVSNYGMLGRPKLGLMRRLGIPVGIGSDGAAGGSIDVFRLMKISQTCQRSHEGASYEDRGIASVFQMLKMATSVGAQVVGLPDRLGTLEVGKLADLTCVDVNDPNCIPVVDPISTLVDSADGHNVAHVIIGGQVVMQNRHLLTVDEAVVMEEVKARAPALQEKLLSQLQ